MSTEKKPRAKRRPEEEILRDLKLRVMRGENKATLRAIATLDAASSLIGDTSGVEDVRTAVAHARLRFVTSLPEALQASYSEPELPFEEVKP